MALLLSTGLFAQNKEEEAIRAILSNQTMA